MDFDFSFDLRNTFNSTGGISNATGNIISSIVHTGDVFLSSAGNSHRRRDEQSDSNKNISNKVNAISRSAIPSAKFRIGQYSVTSNEQLAVGGFGFIDLVTDSFSKKLYVLKRLNIQSTEGHNNAQTEIKFLQIFHGPNIVELLAHEFSPKEAHLLLEYCPNGHLLDRLNERSGSPLNVNGICTIFQQLLSAVARLHLTVPPVVHRDLKLENILFASDKSIRLCDFGSCVQGHVSIGTLTERTDEEERLGKTTTQMYRAPEMVDLYMRDVLTEKTDIWALGCIFYALVFLRHPFQDAGSLGILSARMTFPQPILDKISASSYSVAGGRIRQLIDTMLDIDPEARPTVQQLQTSISCLADGQPIPDLVLSSEATKRRAARIANQNRRMTQQTSRKPAVATPVPAVPRPAVQLTSDSVAAKRLAARRAGPSAPNHTALGTAPSAAPSSSSTADLLDTGFDSTAAAVRPSVSAALTSTSTTSSDFLFDDSPDYTISGDRGGSVPVNWTSQTPATQSVPLFDFADFDSSPVPLPTFATTWHDSSAADPFGLSSVPVPVQPPSKPSAPSHKEDDLLSLFGASSSQSSTSHTAAAAAAASTSVDVFGSDCLVPSKPIQHMDSATATVTVTGVGGQISGYSGLPSTPASSMTAMSPHQSNYQGRPSALVQPHSNQFSYANTPAGPGPGYMLRNAQTAPSSALWTAHSSTSSSSQNTSRNSFSSLDPFDSIKGFR